MPELPPQSAGAFLVAMMSASTEQLRRADPVKMAAKYGIPHLVEFVRFSLAWELERR